MQATRAETLSRGRARARTIGIATGAPLALRTVIGIVMAAHGWQKVQQGVGEFAGFVESLSIPFPTFTAYAVTALELGGGILLILGLATRQWALLIGVEMVLTTILVKVDVGLIADGGAGRGARSAHPGWMSRVGAAGPGKGIPRPRLRDRRQVRRRGHLTNIRRQAGDEVC
jgi:uncharacterized membrane protein YphA (DoxX/SURF4 family)